MRRREFLSLVGACAAAWPLTSRAQQPRTKRIVFTITIGQDDPTWPNYLAAFRAGLTDRGWVEGKNLIVEYHGGINTEQLQLEIVSEIAATPPDLFFPIGIAPPAILKQLPRTPVVFALVNEPVLIGLVDSQAHPGGTATGFSNLEFSFAGKWLDILMELSPTTQLAGFMADPTNIQSIGFWMAFEQAAQAIGLSSTFLQVTAAADIAPAVQRLASVSNSGFVTGTSAIGLANRTTLIGELAKQRLPAVYGHKLFTDAGGLISYGLDAIDVTRRAADYAGQILNGTRIADLPVQAPNKFDLTVNLKAAKALAITVPNSILIRADRVIE